MNKYIKIHKKKHWKKSINFLRDESPDTFESNGKILMHLCHPGSFFHFVLTQLKIHHTQHLPFKVLNLNLVNKRQSRATYLMITTNKSLSEGKASWETTWKLCNDSVW